MSDFLQRAEELVEPGRYLYGRDMVPATSSNFSAGLNDGTLAVTESGRHKGRLTVDSNGNGLFYLNVGDKFCLVLYKKGGPISVPANSTHWFDVGANPRLKCGRFFTAPDGRVGEFTGSGIAKRFPDFVTGLA